MDSRYPDPVIDIELVRGTPDVVPEVLRPYLGLDVLTPLT